jgi:hypothetical protein
MLYMCIRRVENRDIPCSRVVCGMVVYRVPHSALHACNSTSFGTVPSNSQYLYILSIIVMYLCRVPGIRQYTGYWTPPCSLCQSWLGPANGSQELAERSVNQCIHLLASPPYRVPQYRMFRTMHTATTLGANYSSLYFFRATALCDCELELRVVALSFTSVASCLYFTTMIYSGRA